jgi:vacuolar-type H+-ATPase catalytic subunit A/Vma1
MVSIMLLIATGVTDWTGAENMEVVSPLWGLTKLFVAISTLLWIWWHYWQIKMENQEYEEAVDKWLEEGTLPGYEGFIEELKKATEKSE